MGDLCQRMPLQTHLSEDFVEQWDQPLLILWQQLLILWQVLRGGHSQESDVICLFIAAINPITLNNAIEPNQSSAHQ